MVSDPLVGFLMRQLFSTQGTLTSLMVRRGSEGVGYRWWICGPWLTARLWLVVRLAYGLGRGWCQPQQFLLWARVAHLVPLKLSSTRWRVVQWSRLTLLLPDCWVMQLTGLSRMLSLGWQQGLSSTAPYAARQTTHLGQGGEDEGEISHEAQARPLSSQQSEHTRTWVRSVQERLLFDVINLQRTLTEPTEGVVLGSHFLVSVASPAPVYFLDRAFFFPQKLPSAVSPYQPWEGDEDEGDDGELEIEEEGDTGVRGGVTLYPSLGDAEEPQGGALAVGGGFVGGVNRQWGSHVGAVVNHLGVGSSLEAAIQTDPLIVTRQDMFTPVRLSPLVGLPQRLAQQQRWGMLTPLQRTVAQANQSALEAVTQIIAPQFQDGLWQMGREALTTPLRLVQQMSRLGQWYTLETQPPVPHTHASVILDPAMQRYVYPEQATEVGAAEEAEEAGVDIQDRSLLKAVGVVDAPTILAFGLPQSMTQTCLVQLGVEAAPDAGWADIEYEGQQYLPRESWVYWLRSQVRWAALTPTPEAEAQLTPPSMSWVLGVQDSEFLPLELSAALSATDPRGGVGGLTPRLVTVLQLLPEAQAACLTPAVLTQLEHTGVMDLQAQDMAQQQAQFLWLGFLKEPELQGEPEPAPLLELSQLSSPGAVEGGQEMVVEDGEVMGDEPRAEAGGLAGAEPGGGCFYGQFSQTGLLVQQVGFDVNPDTEAELSEGGVVRPAVCGVGELGGLVGVETTKLGVSAVGEGESSGTGGWHEWVTVSIQRQLSHQAYLTLVAGTNNLTTVSEPELITDAGSEEPQLLSRGRVAQLVPSRWRRLAHTAHFWGQPLHESAGPAVTTESPEPELLRLVKPVAQEADSPAEEDLSGQSRYQRLIAQRWGGEWRQWFIDGQVSRGWQPSMAVGAVIRQRRRGLTPVLLPRRQAQNNSARLRQPWAHPQVSGLASLREAAHVEATWVTRGPMTDGSEQGGFNLMEFLPPYTQPQVRYTPGFLRHWRCHRQLFRLAFWCPGQRPQRRLTRYIARLRFLTAFSATKAQFLSCSQLVWRSGLCGLLEYKQVWYLTHAGVFFINGSPSFNPLAPLYQGDVVVVGVWETQAFAVGGGQSDLARPYVLWRNLGIWDPVSADAPVVLEVDELTQSLTLLSECCVDLNAAWIHPACFPFATLKLYNWKYTT